LFSLKFTDWSFFFFQGDFRNTPITLGSANTPQPHLQQQHQQQQQNETITEESVEEMTPTEAENLLSDKLVEKRYFTYQVFPCLVLKLIYDETDLTDEKL
jgi:hypothetical protein